MHWDWQDYYWSWIKRARPHVGVADGLALAVSIIGPAVVLFVPKPEVESARAVVSNLAWQIPLAALGGLTLFRLFATPYWRHKEAAATTAEQIAMRDRQLQAFQAAQATAAQQRQHRIDLLNVKLEAQQLIRSVESITTLPEAMADQVNKWVADTGYQIAQHFGESWYGEWEAADARLPFSREVIPRLHRGEIKQSVERCIAVLDQFIQRLPSAPDTPSAPLLVTP